MKITDITGTVRLHNGLEMPYLGLGVFEMAEGIETIQSIHWALEEGYRHIDTASFYENEVSVGKAVNTSGIKRDEIFITTKLWNSDQGYQNTKDAFRRSLDKLKLDYVDLYLIHWPVRDKFLESWEAMEQLYEKKLIRAIGVSNFTRHQLEDILSRKGWTPMVNQIEYHPRLVQNDLRRFCKSHDIQVQAWSPLMKGRVLEIPELIELGKKYNKTPVQITLRWNLQKGIVTIPKSVSKDRIKANAALFDFELNRKEVRIIDALNQNYRIGPDPDNVTF